MSRTAVTIRFPEEVLCMTREMKPAGVSLNEFVVEVLRDSLRRRRGLRVLDELRELARDRPRRGTASDETTKLIHELREGVGRRD